MLHNKLILFTSILAIILLFAATALATDPAPAGICDTANSEGKICVELQEPLNDETTKIEGDSGVDFMQDYIRAIYQWGASMVGIVAVLNMVISGIQITTAADSERAANAKTRMLQSITALAVLFLSGLILYTVNPTFFTKT